MRKQISVKFQVEISAVKGLVTAGAGLARDGDCLRVTIAVSN